MTNRDYEIMDDLMGMRTDISSVLRLARADEKHDPQLDELVRCLRHTLDELDDLFDGYRERAIAYERECPLDRQAEEALME